MKAEGGRWMRRAVFCRRRGTSHSGRRRLYYDRIAEWKHDPAYPSLIATEESAAKVDRVRQIRFWGLAGDVVIQKLVSENTRIWDVRDEYLDSSLRKATMTKFRKAFVLLTIGLGVMLLSCACILTTIFRGELRKSWYLWFEIPRIQSVIKNIPDISISKVYDNGPSEFHMLVTFDIGNKSQIILANPSYESFTEDKPVYIAGVGNCLMRGVPALAKIPFKQAIAEYDQLYQMALNKYGKDFPSWCK